MEIKGEQEDKKYTKEKEKIEKEKQKRERERSYFYKSIGIKLEEK